jgi:hypothetical protein
VSTNPLTLRIDPSGTALTVRAVTQEW